jgi:hypothetical protein
MKKRFSTLMLLGILWLSGDGAVAQFPSDLETELFPKGTYLRWHRYPYEIASTDPRDRPTPKGTTSPPRKC